jgi:cytoskeletal protein CcmA (bactofilin family)
MFSKAKTTTPKVESTKQTPPPLNIPVDAPHAAPFAKKSTNTGMPSGSKGFSSLGAGLIFEGNVFGAGDLLIDGTVKGDVRVGHLTIGESGNIEGKVEAETIEVRGRIVGSIQGRHVHLQSTAYVEGDIAHDQLSIEIGAFFQGRCLQSRRADNQGISSPVSAVSPQMINPFAAPDMATRNPYDANALSDLK